MLTENDVSFRINRENLPLPNYAELSQKVSIFCCIFFLFFKLELNFQCFEKN